MIHKNARRSLHSLDELYNRLFIDEWLREGGVAYGREDDGNSLKQLLAATNYKSSETRRWRHIRCGI